MNEETIFGRGVSFPPRIGEDGRIKWSSGSENIRESIRVVLLTQPRERLMLPGFGGGLQDFIYEPNIPATHLLIKERVMLALRQWVQRISVENVVVQAAPDDLQTATIDIQYRLVATGANDGVSLSVRVGG